MKHWFAITLACLLPAAAQAINLVVPNSKALVEGDWNNLFPFGDSGSTHYQQVYDASQFSVLGTNGGSIQYIGFRYHGNYNTTPMTYYSMVVQLSTTAQTVDGLSGTFAGNPGLDSTVVFSGRYILGVTAPPADHQLHAWPFPMRVPFTTPFQYNPAYGNLLLDIQWSYASLSTGNGPPWQDAVETTGDPVSRVFAENIYETYIPTNGTADTYGLVTLFGVSPAVPPGIQIHSAAASGTNLVMSGGGGAAGLVYSVLASSDLSAPVSTWAPISTNSFDGSGNFVCTNAIDSTVLQRFYIMQLQ